MFRTYAIDVKDLLDDAKRAAWDKLNSDFERDVEKAECGIVTGGTSCSDGVMVASFHVKKLERVQVAQGVYQKLAVARCDEAAFAAALKNEGKGRVLPDGPRVLEG
jgi:hypothetical protein